MATYTTADFVKKRVKSADFVTLGDPAIENYIEDAEALINASMHDSLLNEFNITKHSIIRACATDLAAYYCISFNPGAFTTLTEAELIMNMLWNAAERALAILSDPRTVDYLKSL